MKKITQLFLTMLMVMSFSLIQAQGVSIQGQMVNNGVPVPNMGFVVTHDTGADSLWTDSAGFFFGGAYAITSTQGSITIEYTDCNGAWASQAGFYGPSTTLIDYSAIEICPTTSTYTASSHIELSNTTGPVNVTISWDNGATTTVVSTNASGISDNSLSGIVVGTSGVFTLEFVDCNGNTVTDSENYSNFNNNLSFSLDFCAPLPPACSAQFGLSQSFTQSPGGIISVNGPVTVTDMSTGSNLTYTWDFGDGSATYVGVNFTHTYANAGPYTLCLSVDDGAGCTNTFCDSLLIDSNGVLTGKTNGGFTIQMGDGSDDTNGPNSINTLVEKVSLEMYPNPATESFNIVLNSEISEDAIVSLYNVMGVLVQQNNVEITNGNQVHNIELNNITKGLYIMQLTTSNGTLSQKLTIK